MLYQSKLVRNYIGGAWFFMASFCWPAAGWSFTGESARWLPENTMAYIKVENVNALRDKFKKSSIYSLYQDPAMQSFMVPAEKKIRQKIDEKLKETWQEMHLEEPPDELPWPQGELICAVFLQSRPIMVPDYSQMQEMEDPAPFDTEALPKVESNSPDFQVVVLADMGDQAGALKQLTTQMTAKAVEQGKIRQRETIRDIEINIIKDKPDQDENYDTFCYGFKDNWLIGGSSIKYIREVLMRTEATDAKSLADRRDFRDTCDHLGSSDVFGYVNAQAIRDVVVGMAPTEQKEKITQTIRLLGFENVGGLGWALRLTPDHPEELTMKILLSVTGEKAGIPALLTPASTSNRSSRLLSKEVAHFLVANYNPARIYDGIVWLAWNIGQTNLDGMIQGMLAVTGQPAEAGRAPVNFKQDIMAQLSAPITVTTRYDKPYSNPDSSKTLLALAVRDGEVLDTALARIHDTFIAQGNKELRRELLNCTIYLLPPIPALLMGMQSSRETEAQTQAHLAFTVAADHLVFGSEKVVEQAIRDLRREDLESIKTDEMYQYAGGHFPAQAGAYYYENEQISAEVLWSMLKEAARQAAQQPSPTAPETQDEIEMEMGAVIDSGGKFVSPLMMIQQFKEYVDFTLLPDFAAVKKYFGATIGYLEGNDKGIYAEMKSLKAPGSSD